MSSRLKVKGRLIENYLDCDIRFIENINLILEQFYIERVCMLDEIKKLNERLGKNDAGNCIPAWEENVDYIYKKIYSYRLGVAGKLSKQGKLLLPYSYRRKIRSLLS
ncbi:hypothetical protein [Klebsiella aerogenes]|uniref:hypothetical protein n=1 Tax=Klebsiella aerogenes TaxID=548 RepID=UPI002073589B|nr:hypothetical protein [Klebsiella aerogenes]